MRALRRLLPYYRLYRRHLVWGLVFTVIGGAVASLNPWLVRSAVDGIRTGAPFLRTLELGAGMLGIALVAGGCRYAMRELMNGLSRRIEYDLRNDLWIKLLSLDATYYGRVRTGEIMARLTNDVGAVRQAAGPAIMYLTNTISGGVFALVFMLRIDAGLTALAILPMTLLPVVMRRLGAAIHTRFEAVQEHFGALTTRVQENVSGTRIVRAYLQEGAEVERFRGMSEEYLRRNLQLARLYGIMDPSFRVLAGAGAVIVLGVGGSLVLRGRITVGSFVAFSMYLGMLTWPMISLGWVLNLFQRASASMGRLIEILDAAPVVTDVAATALANELAAGNGRAPRGVAPRGAPPKTHDNADGVAVRHHSPAPRTIFPPTSGGRSVEFRNVSFHYPAPDGAQPRWVLSDVSFRIEAGQTLAVVGATGSDKSALLDLIPRFHDPQHGEILIDGVPIRQASLADLRAELGIVPQESLLFSDTIRATLRYGAGDEASEEWAAAVAQLSETIADFPGGFDTMLGERGINLSGGQKQRAALARALARRPSIVLLDDALSAVDTHTEAAILHGLRDALRSRTALVASHRVSAVRDADLIIVLDDGRIAQRGTHAELMHEGGRYAELLSRQQLEEEIALG